MATDSFLTTTVLHAPPRRLFDAWIDGPSHAEMTGAGATSDPRVGGAFTAWDGYIEGTHTEFAPGQLIVQAWRCSDFPAGTPDSRLEVHFSAEGEGTRVVIRHSGLPSGLGDALEHGWDEFYFQPMRRLFGAPGGDTSEPARPSRRPIRKPGTKKKAPPKQAASKKATTRKTAAKPKKAMPKKAPARPRKAAPKKAAAKPKKR